MYLILLGRQDSDKPSADLSGLIRRTENDNLVTHNKVCWHQGIPETSYIGVIADDHSLLDAVRTNNDKGRQIEACYAARGAVPTGKILGEHKSMGRHHAPATAGTDSPIEHSIEIVSELSGERCLLVANDNTRLKYEKGADEGHACAGTDPRLLRVRLD